MVKIMDLIPFFIVLLISLGASFIAAKKPGDFFLAGRSLRWPVLLGTFIGTQVGGGFILGNTDAAWKLGWVGSMYGWGLALGMLGLGLGVGSRLRNLNIKTLSELLEKRYESSSLKTIAGVLSIFSLGGILMCQAIGLKKFLSSMNIGNDWIYLLSWGAVVIYTTYGGLLAVVWTDAIQAIIMISLLLITFIYALLPQWSIITSQTIAMGTPLNGAVISSLIIPFCFIFIEQDMAQRCFAAKTPRDASKACIFTAIILILLNIIPTACGILGKNMGLSSENGAIFIQVIKQVSNPFVVTMATSSVLLAIISTASAILLAVSSNVVQDMKLREQRSRLITPLVGLLALLGPYFSDDIIGCMVESYEILVGALFIPIMAAIFTKKKSLPKEAAWGSAILGSIGVLIVQTTANPCAVAIPFILSIIGYILGPLQPWIGISARKRQFNEILVNYNFKYPEK